MKTKYIDVRYIVAALFVCLTFACVANSQDDSPIQSQEQECRGHLRQLGGAVVMYMRYNEGKLPTRIGELYEQGFVLDLRTFVCPSSGVKLTDAKRIDELSDYQVVSELTDERPLRMVWEKAAGHDGATLAFYSDRQIRDLSAMPEELEDPTPVDIEPPTPESVDVEPPAMPPPELVPYTVYHFSSGKLSEEAKEARAALESLVRSETVRTNIELVTVDPTDNSSMAYLPDDVCKLWRSLKNESPSGFLIMTPGGGKLYYGDLTATDVKQLVSSQARTEITRQFAAGNTSILILLEGTNSEFNAEAVQVLDKVAKRLRSGKADGKRRKVAVVKIPYGDKAEKWLARMLLTVEYDLVEFTEDPMVFPAFDGGRVLPPYIAGGISPKNLTSDLVYSIDSLDEEDLGMIPTCDLLLQYAVPKPK